MQTERYGLWGQPGGAQIPPLLVSDLCAFQKVLMFSLCLSFLISEMGILIMSLFLNFVRIRYVIMCNTQLCLEEKSTSDKCQLLLLCI